MSFFNQNKEILLQQNIENNPQKQFYTTDLTQTIELIKQEQDKLIIMGDFNNELTDHHMTKMINEFKL